MFGDQTLADGCLADEAPEQDRVDKKLCAV